jgi:hypothetical protein
MQLLMIFVVFYAFMYLIEWFSLPRENTNSQISHVLASQTCWHSSSNSDRSGDWSTAYCKGVLEWDSQTAGTGWGSHWQAEFFFDPSFYD